MMKHVWLRDEVKPFEKRSALTPEAAKTLMEAGCKVTVEKSTCRIFPDDSFSNLGCEMVESNTWPKAPKDAIILGLKELPLESKDMQIPHDLPHTHIYFAHCYKGQSDWKETMKRFIDAQGLLLDLEFLNDDSGRRVAAFGHSAGYAGMAVGLMIWAHRQIHGDDKPFPPLSPYPSKKHIIDYIASQLIQIKTTPKILVIGALGRCGKGSVEVCTSLGLECIQWDMNETKGGGPFKELLDVDILVNDIYLTGKIPHFLTLDMLKQEHKLSVFVDVSCDTTNPNNPFPIYNFHTYFDKPTTRVEGNVDVVAIDHLPTLLPKESSEDFLSALTPHLKNLITANLDSKEPTIEERVWIRAKDLYLKKVEEYKKSQ